MALPWFHFGVPECGEVRLVGWPKWAEERGLWWRRPQVRQSTRRFLAVAKDGKNITGSASRYR